MKKNIRVPKDYIPMDCWKEAKSFYLTLRDDVEIYKKFKSMENTKPSEEADKYVAWFSMQRYADYPHSLFLIYEHMDEINEKTGEYDLLDGFKKLEFKLILIYRLLKEYGMIDE